MWAQSKNRVKRVLTCIVILMVTAGCNDDEPGLSSDNGRPIGSSEEALEIFNALNGYFLSFQNSLPEGNLNEDMPGVSGSATARGSRNVTRSSSSSGSFNAEIIDTFIDFQAFTPESSTLEITGTIRFFSAVSSRIRCSGSFCASSSDNSRAIETRPELNGEIEFVEITYQLGSGMWINDVISVDSTSPDYTQRWTSIAIETESGESYAL